MVFSPTDSDKFEYGSQNHKLPALEITSLLQGAAHREKFCQNLLGSIQTVPRFDTVFRLTHCVSLKIKLCLLSIPCRHPAAQGRTACHQQERASWCSCTDHRQVRASTLLLVASLLHDSKLCLFKTGKHC